MIDLFDTKYVAFVDESGGYGFDFSKEGTSKYFIVTSVLVNKLLLDEFYDQVKKLQLVLKLTDLPVSLHVLIVDKEKLSGDGLTSNKAIFYTYLFGKMYETLYNRYDRLKVYADMHGSDSFMERFNSYVLEKQNMTLFSFAKGVYQSFDFVDSKENLGVQVADLFCGAISKIYEPNKITEASVRIEVLLNTLKPQSEFFPRKYRDYVYKPVDKDEDVDRFIAQFCYNEAQQFIDDNSLKDEDKTRYQIAFVQLLLDHFLYSEDDSYVQTQYIANRLNAHFYKEPEFEPDYVTRSIVGELRLKMGLIIASSSKGGYKIPTKLSDIYDYLNHCNSILEPMLKRMFLCHDIISDLTGDIKLLKCEEYRSAYICYQNQT